jgi:nitric-oxide synthase, brain
LSNVKFAVFALGSTAYPNYCAFGKYLDNMLADLGGERLMDLATGDEICGQEQAYREWAPEVFKQACESFCLEAAQSLSIASKAMKREQLTEEMLRLEPIAKATAMDEALAKYHNKKAKICTANGAPTCLHEVTNDAERLTMIIKLKTNNVSNFYAKTCATRRAPQLMLAAVEQIRVRDSLTDVVLS